jgi:hypothetical protein
VLTRRRRDVAGLRPETRDELHAQLAGDRHESLVVSVGLAAAGAVLLAGGGLLLAVTGG